MNPYRDASPRQRCTKCRMRPSRCLCVKPSECEFEKRRGKQLYRAHDDPRQSTLTRRAGPARQLLGWWQPTARHRQRTAPPRCPASTNLPKTDVSAVRSATGVSKGGEAATPVISKTVTDGKAAAKTIGEGLNNPRD
jgi:hypothetical protein